MFSDCWHSRRELIYVRIGGLATQNGKMLLMSDHRGGIRVQTILIGARSHVEGLCL